LIRPQNGISLWGIAGVESPLPVVQDDASEKRMPQQIAAERLTGTSNGQAWKARAQARQLDSKELGLNLH